MRRLGGVLIALSAVLVLAVAPVSAADTSGQAVFNTPKPWGTLAQRYAIVNKVARAIEQVPRAQAGQPKPVVLVTSFLLDNLRSVDAMIAACRRGVSVRVILDADIESAKSRKLITALNSDNAGQTNPSGPCNTAKRNRVANATLSADQALRSAAVVGDESAAWGPDGSYVKKCQGSCRGAGGNMHSKFYAFSQTGTSHNVVMVSSSNLNAGGANKGWNDMYIMRGRPTSFAAYKAIHREMTEDTRAGDGKVEITDGPYTSRFFPMRNADKSNDPTLQDLNTIRCTSDLGRTRVDVSMFYWAGTRGMYLAKKLISLARDGCQVSVIYGAPSKEVRLYLRQFAANRLIRVYDSRLDYRGDSAYDVRTHGKYVLVRGTFDGSRSARVVLTGTQNWVAGSLSRGDENTLNIKLAGAYSAYKGNWDRVRAHSKSIPQ